jgi:hypothetical protein
MLASDQLMHDDTGPMYKETTQSLLASFAPLQQRRLRHTSGSNQQEEPVLCGMSMSNVIMQDRSETDWQCCSCPLGESCPSRNPFDYFTHHNVTWH